MGVMNCCKEIYFVNLPQILAVYKTKLYMGGGIEFYHNNKTIYENWKKFSEATDFYNFIFAKMIDVSKYGGCIIGVEPTKSGIPVLTVNDTYLITSLEQAYTTHDVAVFYQKVKLDNTFYLLKTTYDKETIRREIYNYDKQDEKIEMFGLVSKLPDDKKLEWGEYDKEQNCYVYKHNLGMVPFVCISNIPFIQKWPMISAATKIYFNGYQREGYSFSMLSDTYGQENLEKHINFLYRQIWDVSEIDKPRILISNASMYKENEKAMEKRVKESSVITTLNAPLSAKTSFATLQMTNSLDNYNNMLQADYAQYFRNAGLDYPTNEEKTNKTTSGTYLKYANSILTIKSMRYYVTNKILQIIKIAMKAMGNDDFGKDSDWNFIVKNSLPTDYSALRQDLSIDLQNGIIDQADMYQQIYGGDRDNAINQVKKVKKFNSEMGFDPTNHNVSGVSANKSPEGSFNSKNAGRKPDNKKAIKA